MGGGFGSFWTHLKPTPQNIFDAFNFIFVDFGFDVSVTPVWNADALTTVIMCCIIAKKKKKGGGGGN